jgi:hypothetical protein
MSERLPQELIAAIVDNIWDDKKSLKAFSLVCKAWTNPARDHLFATLTISDIYHGHRSSDLSDLISIFAPFLRHLELFSIFYSYKHTFWQKVIPLLVDFRSPRLRTLTFDGVTWPSITPSDRSAFLSRFGSIISLQLDASRMTLAEVADFICSLPHLETLILKGRVVDCRVPPASSPRLHLPERLSTLGVYCYLGDYPPFLDWLLSFPQQPCLRTLHFRTLCMFGADHFNKLFKTLGPSLEVIRCGTFGAKCMLMPPTRILVY